MHKITSILTATFINEKDIKRGKHLLSWTWISNVNLINVIKFIRRFYSSFFFFFWKWNIIDMNMYTFPERKESRVSFCSFGDIASTDVALPVKYATFKWDKSSTLFKIMSMTLAVIILSTKMRHNTFVASLKVEPPK